ncbi:hypothetical protein FBY35_0121 [Streptomyces sp. SLBN-118]|uniref:hypothetical protein n=1 Tax=Streptomyces sp. SLBN-118 TaxID=2768454 RepID=UPI00114FFD80|nr:hypothetical protein [Streptomyces sp. SLBN-118]TQK49847.1 hypothetical protein FBY35_0121 [Streptomyces sp. SLBN-118]
MRLCSTHPPVPRTWTVELRPHHGGPVLYCPRCSPSGHALQATSARPAVLEHLARHARSDALPAHLRTCQCHERDCRWHPRHRGCTGPILLVLTREHGGRTWRLADTCASCAAATPHAAVIPDTALNPSSTQRLPGDGPGSSPAKRMGRPRGASEQVPVQEMLSYLAAALPTGTSPEARLLALQCALRANRHGQVRLPTGLLRAMRLGHASAHWHELECRRWLCPVQRGISRQNDAALPVQLLDPLTQASGRAGRLQAADWALRVISRAPLKGQPAGLRLAALALAAHRSPAHTQAGVEADRLSRACGIKATDLGPLLDHLVEAGTIKAWACDPHTEDLHWTPSRPAARPVR